MKKYKKIALLILLILNILVLLGQVWPEGVPPFAQTINYIFLTFTILYFSISLYYVIKK
ncbi:MAG: hypothetical protein RBS29_03555 [Bacteroidales bacterium]|nr:hypothetical protein [Bacteroidales bacterium]